MTLVIIIILAQPVTCFAEVDRLLSSVASDEVSAIVAMLVQINHTLQSFSKVKTGAVIFPVGIATLKISMQGIKTADIHRGLVIP